MKRVLLFALLSFFTFFGAHAQYKKCKCKLSKMDTLIVISTSHGDMTLVLFDHTPIHKRNFIKLTEQGFYDSTAFHRILKDFMIQGGDPNSKDDNPQNDGVGGPGYKLPPENMYNSNHIRGALAAARQGDQANQKRESSGSQFYIVHPQKGAHFLNGQYTVFGQLLDGFETLDKIASVPVGGPQKSSPKDKVVMTVKTKVVARKEVTAQYGYKYKQ